MTEENRKILVTSALPYANGAIHIGHLVEYIQTDIWVRFQRSRGHHLWYVCADDAHGTPIMLKAEAEGMSPEALIERVGAEHRRDFAAFRVDFDNYHSTHSAENRAIAERIYRALEANGHITQRSIRQAFDPERQMFLPDRFIRGRCPRCDAPDQYGDSCERCGATYLPTDLKDPVSVLSGATPVERESEHFFFQLGHFEAALREWMHRAGVQAEVVNKLEEWFEAGLKDWDISRDAPYFGFEIPGAPGKFFYVWLDAPIGYFASLRNLCERTGEDFEAFIAPDSDVEMHHFIGKDIVYFHTLFWPAMLHGAGLRKPTAVHAHGFLTVDGQKMSKSRGTFITAETYLAHLNPEYLRYYFAAKLSARVEDIDLSLEDFVQRVNADLVGKFVNIASRCARFIGSRFEGRLGPRLDQPELIERMAAAAGEIGAAYEQRELARAVRLIMGLADEANRYIDERKPWELARAGGDGGQVQAICTTGLNAFRLLVIYLKPVLPATAERAEAFLRVPPLAWDDAAEVLLDHAIAPYEPLLTRVDPAAVQAMVEASREDLEETGGRAAAAPEPPAPAQGEAAPAQIGIEDFARVDLRVARVAGADYVEGADKLLALRLDLGDSERQVLAGIRSAYEPAELLGRLVVVVANLAPRKMRFGVSEGMVLAAGPGGSEIWLLAPDSGAEPGMKVT